ncbi:MAG: hypothetical protein A3A86_05120 [Elusimicrobia bacterium RIFCSPLOWO2_01_FULL_60_11]|nr:MAG: hypothetical protein A3A86_05120 [Elusimicrobia bacterium RIFCSPLOWO2_01_FULL_60_11]
MKRFLTAWAVLSALAAPHPAPSGADEPPRRHSVLEMTKALEKYSKDANPEMRILAVQMMGEVGGAAASKTLRKLFRKEKDNSVRRAILVQLAGVLPDGKGTLYFFCQAARRDPDPETRFIALNEASLLPRPGDRGTRELRLTAYKIMKNGEGGANRVLAAVILRELGEEGREISKLVLDGLSSPAAETRRRAASVLDPVEGQDELLKVARAARDAELDIRANLCLRLGKIRDKATVPVLKILLEDPDLGVRRDAQAALASFENNP